MLSFNSLVLKKKIHALFLNLSNRLTLLSIGLNTFDDISIKFHQNVFFDE